MKKYLFVLVALISVFSFMGSVNAANPEEEFGWNYADGWFDKNPGKFTAPIEIYDNDLKTYKYSGINGSFEIKFHEPLSTGILGFYASSSGTYGSFTIYNGNKSLYTGSVGTQYVAVKIFEPIDRIRFSSNSYGSISVMEFDLFETANYPTVKNLKAKQTFNEISVEWENPTDSIGSRIYFDNVLVKTLGKDDKIYKFDGLKANTKYAVSVSSIFKDGESVTNDISVTTNKVPILPSDFVKVSDIGATTALFNLNIDKLPSVPKFVKIYKTKDDTAPIEVPVYSNHPGSKKIEGLKSETEYTYYVSVDYGNGNVTDMLPVTFKTTEPVKEVSELTATATAQEVSLKWKMPVYQNLDFARIYRQKNDANMFARMFKSASTYEPLFETNGTTFKDLTVKSDTEYQYKVTTVDKTGNESEGKLVTVKTKKMGASGGGVELDPDGNYVITWTSPTTGKMKVLVGGKEYAVVPASDKKIVIPKDKMVFDIIGNPDVKLIPIDDDGNEGIPSKPGGNGTGNGGGIGDIVGGGDLAEVLNPENTVKNGMELLVVVGAFLLLGLAFRVVPKLVKMIRNAFSNKKDERIYSGRRRVEE